MRKIFLDGESIASHCTFHWENLKFKIFWDLNSRFSNTSVQIFRWFKRSQALSTFLLDKSNPPSSLAGSIESSLSDVYPTIWMANGRLFPTKLPRPFRDFDRSLIGQQLFVRWFIFIDSFLRFIMLIVTIDYQFFGFLFQAPVPGERSLESKVWMPAIAICKRIVYELFIPKLN